MSTNVKEVPKDPPNGDQATSDSSTQNQTTNDPPAGNTDVENRLRQMEERMRQQEQYASLLEEQTRSQQQTISRLSTQPAPATPQPPAQPQLTPEQRKARFYTDPDMVITEVVRRELHETIRPLQEFVQSFRGGTELDRILTKFKQNPRLASQIDGGIESAVKQMFENSSVEVTEEMVQAALLQVIGARAAGLIPAGNGGGGALAPTPPPTPTPTSQPGGSVQPPHMRPSNPVGTAPAGTKTPSRQLTELEKRIARERGMSDADYLAWLEVPADQVVASSIGRPKS